MRPEKANIVKDLKDKLDASPFLLVADYTGLKVDQFAVLRTVSTRSAPNAMW